MCGCVGPIISTLFVSLFSISPCSVNTVVTTKSLMIRYRCHVTYTGENRNTYIDLTENLEEKGPLGRNRRRWEDKIRIRLE